MTFDVTSHSLLSDGAAALDPDTLAAHTRVAAAVLGLASATLTDDEALLAADAVALQVSYQVDSLPDRDWGALLKESPFEWAEGCTNPAALRIARSVAPHTQRAAGAVTPHPRTPALVSDALRSERDLDVPRYRSPFGFDIR